MKLATTTTTTTSATIVTFSSLSFVAFLILQPQLTVALVPHTFWTPRSAFTINQQRALASSASSKGERTNPRAQWNMYFDDCERRSDVEEWEAWIPALGSTVSSRGARIAWTTSRSEEKKQAIERLLGYNPISAAALSEDQIETETLQWALDCNIIWAGDHEMDEDDDGEQQEGRNSVETTITSMYSSLSDLIVASECKQTVDCVALLWSLIAKLLDLQELNSVYMVVFPNATSMWEYEVMVTVLQAFTVSRPLLPPNMQLDLDLFHPDYKYAPRMWSPEMHSPFPTLGLSIKPQPGMGSSTALSSSQRSTHEEQSLEDEVEDARSRLEALFDSADADERVNARSLDERVDTAKILADCQVWAKSIGILMESMSASGMEWIVDTHTQPFQLYSRLWTAIQGLEAGNDSKNASTTMLIAPNLDAYTTQRIAITVNAALQRLQSQVRVANVFHPNFSTSNSSRQAPHAMIELRIHDNRPPR